MPGLPAFCRTRFNAARRFRRSHALSIRSPVPGRSSPLPTVGASTRKRDPCGFTAPVVCALGLGPDFCGMASPRCVGVSPSPSFGPSPLLRLIRPLLTSRPDDLLDHRHPFRRKARSPQVRTSAVPARAPDLRDISLVAKSFTISCSLALIYPAFYPISVRRPTGLATRFFQQLSRDHHLAVRSGRCDQLPRGLPPPSRCSC